MAHSDTELIKRTLDGDGTAFGFLVDKYKGAVHALAYRKIGDFHTAEEITQDTFLQAYQKLSTLKDWRHFPGWLYTIASRFCLMWHRKNRLPMQSIDAVERDHVDALAQAKYANEQTRQTVHSALEELPESQRTVLTLHYLGGMTAREIARFMGTSRGAILDRLYRARLQLREELIPMMRQTLGAFQLPPSFTTQMMNRIDQLRPTATPASKPLMPWVAATATLVVAIFIGLGQQSMTRTQRPYSLDATESSVQVELIDAPVIYRPETKLILANRSGGVNQRNEKSDARSDGTGLGSTSNDVKNLGMNGSKWVQTNGPTGGRITRILRASDDSLYAATDSPRVFRSDTNGDTWIDIGEGLDVYPDGQNPWAQSITEADGIIYLNDDLGVFHSNTRGEFWHWVKYPDRTEASTAFAVSGGRIYINRDRDGVAYSDNYGKSWTPMHYGLPAKPPDRLMTVGTTLFAKIGDELFRLKANETFWTKITTFQNLRFFTATQSALVIGNRTDLHRSTDQGDTWIPMTGKVRVPASEGEENAREFRLLITAERKGLILATQIGTQSSTRELEVWIPPMTTKDGDGSLKEMKSNEVDSSKPQVPTVFEFRVLSIEGIAVIGNTVHLLLSDGKLLRSTENGRWITTETKLKNREVNSMVALSEHSVCVATDEGAYRWRDGEKSWGQINKGLVSTYVHDLVSYKNALYAITSYTIVKSVDGGNRWMPVHQGLPTTEASTFAIADGVLYLALNETNMGSRTKPSTAGIYSLAPDENSWIPVQTEMRTDNLDHPEMNLYPKYERLYSVDELVISGNTFYAIAQMGSGWLTYRWRKGERFWTAISPNVERSPDSFWSGLAVSGETVYFDARGNLMCSNNQGHTWSRIDSFPRHNEPAGQIEGPIIIGNSVYLAVSDLGVFRSTNRGKTWKSLDAGLPQAYSWELEAVENTLFAIEWEKGIYQWKDDQDTWVFVKPYPYPRFLITAMAVVNTTLYAATGGQGVYRIDLDQPVSD